MGRTKEIDGELSLHKKLAPETGGELAVTARKDSGEVVFERANRALSWICMVIVGIDELILEVLGGLAKGRFCGKPGRGMKERCQSRKRGLVIGAVGLVQL